MKYGFMILILWISACASLTVYSESQAIDLVMKSIERNQLTALKTECLMFFVENKTTFYEIDVREKHNQHCGGDPATAPRLFTYQVNKQTGSLKIDESVLDGWYRLLQNKDIIMDENKIIPHFSQRQLLTNLLEIMEISHSKDDFTPENISKIFGVTLNVSKNGEFFWRDYNTTLEILF